MPDPSADAAPSGAVEMLTREQVSALVRQRLREDRALPLEVDPIVEAAPPAVDPDDAFDALLARVEAEAAAEDRERALDFESMTDSERQTHRDRFVAAHGIRAWRHERARMREVLDDGVPDFLAMSPAARDALRKERGDTWFSNELRRQLRRAR